MRLRLTKIDEFQFLTCLKHGLWGSKSARFKDWHEGDNLGIIVEKAVAGVAEVNGSAFVSKERIWDNGLFPHRIPVKFIRALMPDHRPPILGKIREALTSAWGPKYGWGILNQNLLPETSASLILGAINSFPNDLKEIREDLDLLLEQAKRQRQDRVVPGRRIGPRKARLAKSKVAEDVEVGSSRGDSSAHFRAQKALIRLGRATGCSVWVASNDRNRMYQGKVLGEDCLKALPNLGLSREAADRIARIDIIWLRQKAPVCAFEVETTTAIYSGLLRMSDLLALVPALNMKLFIVAPRERQAKVMDELARPTFQKIGLSEYCRFIAIEDLQLLYEQTSRLEGHVQPSVVDTIAVQLEEDMRSALE